MNRIAEFEVQFAQRTRLVQARHGVFNTERFDIGAKRLPKIGDRCFFTVAFAVGGDVWNSRSESAPFPGQESAQP